MSFRKKKTDQGSHYNIFSIIPSSAHAAFDKAGAYLKIKVRHIKVDPITRKVPINRVARAMFV